jgi:hypothetical protein
MGSGEQSYYKTMKSAPDMSSLLAELRENGYPPGARRAFFMARVLEENSVIVVGAKCPQIVRDLHMIAAADMDEAFQIATHKMGRSDLDVLIVPHALSTLPIVQE